MLLAYCHKYLAQCHKYLAAFVTNIWQGQIRVLSYTRIHRFSSEINTSKGWNLEIMRLV